MPVLVSPLALDLGHHGIHVIGIGSEPLREQPDAQAAKRAKDDGVENSRQSSCRKRGGNDVPEQLDACVHEEEERPNEGTGKGAKGNRHHDEQSSSHGLLAFPCSAYVVSHVVIMTV